MPNSIRAILSVVVVLVTAVAFYFEQAAGAGARWYVLVLGAVMTAAVWLFPETKGTKGKAR